MGLVSREQKLGKRIVPSKVLYLKNIVTADDLRDDASYTDICADIRLEAEKFGPVVSLEVPRSRGGAPRGGMPHEPLHNALTGGMFALEDNRPDAPGAEGGKATTTLAAMPVPEPVAPLALVPVGKNNAQLAVPGVTGGGGDGATSGEFDPNAPGIGFAFIEFANVEGSSRAKKALHGRRFGTNEVECDYFSEDKYFSKDFANPTPNTDEPKLNPGMELALVATGGGAGGDALEEAPVMAD